MDELTNRIVLPGGNSEGPAIPDAFWAQLRQYDPDLTVSWNPYKGRHMIEKCHQHHGPNAFTHTHACGRYHVAAVQDEEGVMLPFGPRVIELIARADNERKGYGPNDLQKFCQDTRGQALKERAEIDAESAAVIRYASKHNRRQLHQAIHLIQQHNLTPNK